MSEVKVLSWIHNILYVFTAVSFPIYITVVITLIKHWSKLKSSFFVLFLSTSIADLVATFHKYMTRHIPMILFGSSCFVGNVWLATFHRMGIWSLYFTQVVGVLLITVNRMTTLGWPMRYKMLWTRRRIGMALAVQWILPLGFAIPMFHPIGYSYYGEAMTPHFNNSEFHSTLVLIDMIIEPGFLLPSLILCYMVTYWKMRQFAKKVKPAIILVQKKQPKKNGERNLVWVGVTLIVIYSSLCIVYIMFWFEVSHLFILYLFYPLSDLFAMSNPYLLLMFSSMFRPLFVKTLKCTKH